MKTNTFAIVLIPVLLLGLVSCSSDDESNQPPPGLIQKQLNLQFTDNGTPLPFNSTSIATNTLLEINGLEENQIDRIKFKTQCNSPDETDSKSGEKPFQSHLTLKNFLPITLFQPFPSESLTWECDFEINILPVSKEEKVVKLKFKNDINLHEESTQFQPLVETIDKASFVSAAKPPEFSSLISSKKTEASQTEQIHLLCENGKHSQLLRKTDSFQHFLKNAASKIQTNVGSSRCRLAYQPNSSEQSQWDDFEVSPIFTIVWDHDISVLVTNKWIRPLAAIEKSSNMELLRFKIRNPNPFTIYINPEDFHESKATIRVGPILRTVFKMNSNENMYEQPNTVSTPLFWELGKHKDLKKIIPLEPGSGLFIQAFGGKAYDLYKQYHSIGKNICKRWPHGMMAGFKNLPKIKVYLDKEKMDIDDPLSLSLDYSLMLGEQYHDKLSLFFRFPKEHPACPRPAGYPMDKEIRWLSHNPSDFFFNNRQ